MTIRVLILISFLFGATSKAAAQGEASTPRLLDEVLVDYESGVLSILQNDGRYGAQGTAFGVNQTNQRKNLIITSRTSLELAHGAHRLTFLYAPLDLTTRATLDEDLQFRSRVFDAGTSVEHRYLFDGYRGSYTYQLPLTALSLQVGGSLQVRNAKVAFARADGSGYVEEADIGLVPALKVRATYRAPSGLYALLDADGSSTFGLVGDTEGGLYDVALSLGIPVTKQLDLFLRTRGVGGGATVPDKEIENWAHFLSFTAGLRLDLSAWR